MEWSCEHCGRSYGKPPADVCVSCGHPAVLPAGTEGRDPVAAYMDRVRRSLLDPASLDRGLADGGTAVTVAFRIVLLASAALLLAVAVATLI